MQSVPRKTLVLVIVLALVLVGALISTLTLGHGDDAEVHTRLVLEMVANMNGLWHRVGLEAPPGVDDAARPRLGSGLMIFLTLAALAVAVIRSRRTALQQHSRSSRS